MVDTSATVSPRAVSHRLKCRPSPSAFSTAQPRCGEGRAQAIKRLYSARVASMRIEPRSVLVTGSTAVAVWVLLCGSTPMTTMNDGSLSHMFGVGIRGGHSDFKYLARACGHASLQSRPERRPGGATYPRRVSRKPLGDRNLRSQSTRPAAARYG